jgi:hypothetical protein
MIVVHMVQYYSIDMARIEIIAFRNSAASVLTTRGKTEFLIRSAIGGL